MKKVVSAVLVFGLGIGAVMAGGQKHHKHKQRPSNSTIRRLQTIELKHEIVDGQLHLQWSPATDDDSGGVKVAYSTEHDQPLYPFDKYAKWLPGKGHRDVRLSNKLVASSKPRWYRICSVKRGNHHEYVAFSNVIKVPAIEYEYKSKKKYGERKKSHEKESKKEQHANFCTQCGNKVSKMDTFCGNCGHRLKD